MIVLIAIWMAILIFIRILVVSDVLIASGGFWWFLAGSSWFWWILVGVGGFLGFGASVVAEF